AIPTNKPMVRIDLPDSIYRTEKGKFQAIVREVKKRHKNGQPLLVGTISIEKNEYLSALLRREGIPHEILNAKNHEREAQIIAQAGHKSAVTIATNMAGRGIDIVLGGHPTSFKSKEEWGKAHREVTKLGGLFIIGSERHESRRIDDQLRGRAGRQGDPGSSQFFVSLEDKLMRVFAPEKIKRMMLLLKIPEDMPIENKMISRAIENAQGKVEGFNFDIRKHLLEYDDVVNKQRKKIYDWRKKILLQETDPSLEYLRLSQELIQEITNFHCQGPADKWNLEEIAETTNSFFNLTKDLHSELMEYSEKDLIQKYIFSLIEAKFKQKVIDAKEELKNIFLSVIDYFWMEHLEEMDYLKESVRLRAYGQKDPLVEYRHEGQTMFKKLLQEIRNSIVKTTTNYVDQKL
ncbi:MAG TPA: preprotein translocase subunit SecA, partial [Candidatus Portnoybacteria bacterium]|nr:preprotein translocase subunit SecA [Candidatus Portnoybacteria bacterium]